jgi:signal transduction histidine kinase
MKDLRRRTREKLIQEIEKLRRRFRILERSRRARRRLGRPESGVQRSAESIWDIHERDRQLTAYEIHDGFAQKATAALMQLQAFEGLRDHDPEQAEEAFHAASSLIKQSIEEARSVITGLQPPMLQEAGLIAAIDTLVNDVRMMGGPEIEFSHNGNFDDLASPLEHAVFRIVQECLTNARRHSGSDIVRIRLMQSGDRVQTEVEDDGIGFDPRQVPPDRFGLRGIRKRAEVLGGVVQIDSTPGCGTRIAVRLPLTPRKEVEGDLRPR